MKGIVDVKAVIRRRLAELQESERWLSQRLGKNPSYINDFLKEDGSPRDLSYEIKLMVADVLKVPPRQLGVMAIGEKAVISGFSDDAEPYEPPDVHYLSTRLKHIVYVRMKTFALDQHEERIKPGDILAFDLNVTKSSEIRTGRIVYASALDKHDLAKTHGRLIRQFVSPNKLITNSSVDNEIKNLDDPSEPYEIVIRGALLSVVRETNGVPR